MNQHTMNKDKWRQLFISIGLDEPTMDKWHHEFESQYPQEHKVFLEWLQIPAKEIQGIRQRSQAV
ncbi:MAG: hypothetical protein ACD_62C00240G0009 [uncultured bacterium]|nr:MAG: hypothetical protein ACD_62C00240G0009 [uncultured bacterium]